MDGRIDPTTTLGQQDAKTIRRNGVGLGVRRELHLEGREVLHHDSRQVSIFTKREQVLLVQRVDVGFRVLLDDAVRDDDGPTLVRGPDTIHRETTRKTGHRAEQALE